MGLGSINSTSEVGMVKNVKLNHDLDTIFCNFSPFLRQNAMLILAFEANSALSRENETKIVKITHSAPSSLYELKECNFVKKILNCWEKMFEFAVKAFFYQFYLYYFCSINLL